MNDDTLKKSFNNNTHTPLYEKNSEACYNKRNLNQNNNLTTSYSEKVNKVNDQYELSNLYYNKNFISKN